MLSSYFVRFDAMDISSSSRRLSDMKTTFEKTNFLFESKSKKGCAYYINGNSFGTEGVKEYAKYIKESLVQVELKIYLSKL